MAVSAIPSWVAPSPRQVSDLHWLAWRQAADTRAPYACGVEHAMAWIAGQQTAPFTGREGGPEQRADAELEFRAGGATIDTTGSLWKLTAAELGLSEWIPRARHPKWTDGAHRTVKWMLSGEVKDTPLDIPVRLADGTTPTAEQLYSVAFAACPHAFDMPEQRQELLLRTAANAARYRKLAALIEDTKNNQ